MATRQRLQRNTPWIVVAVAPFVVFITATLNLSMLAPQDGYLLNIPWYELAARSWTSGQLPAWNPFSFGGTALLSMQQAAVFSPTMILFAALPTSLAANWNVISAFAIAGLGAALLASCFVTNRVAWVTSGFAFGFAAFFFGHISHPGILLTFAYLPWLCATYLRLVNRPSWKRFMAAVAVGLLALVAGHGQAFIMSVMYLGVFVLGDALFRTRKEVLRRIGWAVAVLGIVGALGAIQLVPAAVYTANSGRDHYSYSRAMSFSFPKSHAELYMFPRAFGVANATGPFHGLYSGSWNTEELTGYVAMMTLFLAVGGLIYYKRNRYVRTFAVLAILGFLLAFPRSNPLGPLLYQLPILGQFRSWARYTVFCSLSMAMLAGFGVQALVDGRLSKRTIIRTAAVLGGVALFGFIMTDHFRVHRFLARSTSHLLLFGPTFVFIAISAGLLLYLRNHRRLLALIPALIVVDVFLSYGITAEWATMSPSVATVNADAAGTSVPGWGSTYATDDSPTRYIQVTRYPERAFRQSRVLRTDLLGMYAMNGLDPLAPREFRQRIGGMSEEGVLRNAGRLTAPNSWLPDILRISTLVVDTRTAQDAVPPTNRIVTQNSIGTQRRQIMRYTMVPRLPEIYAVGSVTRLQSEQVIPTLVNGRVDLQQTAVIEDDCANCPQNGAKATITQVKRKPNDTTFTTTANNTSFVVLSQTAAKGWTATIDGKPAALHLTNGFVQGLRVPAGTHRVAVHYQPPGFTAGLAVTSVTAFGLMAFYVVSRRRRNRSIVDLTEKPATPATDDVTPLALR